jgi:hypothetical protein
VVLGDERPTRVLYVGDFDADGEGIEENAEMWIDADEWTRVAITPEQIREHDLAANTGKPLSSQRQAFLAKHGVDIQVEVEALRPDELRRLVEHAILDGWDGEAYERVQEAEEAEQERLTQFLAEWGHEA